MATEEIVARKHWIAYLHILLGYGIWFLILLAVVSFLYIAPQQSIRSFAVQPNVVQGLGAVVLVVIAISLFFFLRSWMETKRFTWTAEEDRLVLRSGWMPWQRTDFGMPYETIFEAYVRFGFFDKLFGSRDCVIRRTEGVTSQTVAANMKNGEEVCRAINRKVKEIRALRYAGPQMIPQLISEAPRVEPAKTQTEQLKELAALKADGTLTAEEFDLMKRKILQS